MKLNQSDAKSLGTNPKQQITTEKLATYHGTLLHHDLKSGSLNYSKLKINKRKGK